MKEIERRLFVSLCRDNFKRNHYIVLNDGNYHADFYADNDDDAIRIFRAKEYQL